MGVAKVCHCGCTSELFPLRLELEELEEGRGQQDVEAEITPEIITMPSRFEKVQEKGFIDVWWLYDDGGEWAGSSKGAHTFRGCGDSCPAESVSGLACPAVLAWLVLY